MRQNSPEMDDWVASARQVACSDEIARRSVKLKRSGSELVGPCPACGGDDRFSINLRKNVFHCRKSGAGGDAIALVMYLDGADFLGACETLTGEPPPKGEAGRRADPALQEQRRREADAHAAQRARDENVYRDREIRRAQDIWRDAGKLSGSIAEIYLKFRGLVVPPGAKLRCVSRLAYWHRFDDGTWHEIHHGPALVGAIQGPDGRFCGVHCTYIDPRLATATGKAEIAHPETGELLPAKKVRGSAKGGHIHLGGSLDARMLIAGEGIETTLTPATVFGADEAGRLYWATVSLGNMGGKAKGRVPHPTETRVDKRGAKRRVMVPDDVPLEEPGEPVLMPPDTVREIILLGDGDSDRFTTELVLKRAARRWAAPGRRIRAAWAEDGGDFNSMLRGAA